MRTQSLACVAWFALFLSAAAAGFGQSADQAKSELQAVYNKIDAAAARKDAAAALAYYSKDYVGTLPDGRKMTYEQLKVMLPQMLQAVQSMKSSSKVLRVVRKGTAFVATVRSHAELTANNQRTGKTMKVAIDTEEENTWVKAGGKWKNTLGKTLKSKQTVDGQPIPQP